MRCRAELYRTAGVGLDTPIALAASALALFVLAVAYPLASLSVNGTRRVATLVGAVLDVYRQGFGSVALLVFLTTVLVPLGETLAFLYVLVPLRAGRRAPGQDMLLRALATFRPWAMPEVFMLGALVALVKLSAMATVVPQISLACYGLFMMALAALISTTPTEQLWQWAERCRA